jgi:hypothetical protein
MPHNRAITFRVAGRNECVLPALLVSLLILSAAISSSQPMTVIAAIVLLLGAAWVLFTQKTSKASYVNLTSVIFPDGSVKIKSDADTKFEGVLRGQQWCNSQFAVLKFVTAGKNHRFVLLSAQQNAADYRRLLVWLRQDLLLKSEGIIQS